MRAIVVPAAGGPDALKLVEVPIPATGIRQVRVQVEAAAVQPVDLITRAGDLISAGLMSRRTDIGMGWDVAGRVVEVGPGVTGFAPGDRVIGLRDRLDVGLGTYAEYVVLDATVVAQAPANLSPVEASTLPLAGLTAYQSLDLLGLPEGATLLVTGAAGAVGGYAIELARLRGLRVLAHAGAADEAFVGAAEAEWFVPRSTDLDLAERVRSLVPGGVDGALDAAVLGLPALAAVRNAGAFVSVGGTPPPPLRQITVVEEWIAANGDLARLSAFAENGQITPRVAATRPLHEAAEAHRLMANGDIIRGRVVLIP